MWRPGPGAGTSLPDREYQEAGATLLPDAASVWAQSEIVCKVKEPQPSEYPLIRPDHVLFTFFHFAASRPLVGGDGRLRRDVPRL